MDDTAQPPRIPSSLPIRLETLAPHPDAYPTHLYVANDRCGRCNQLTLLLRIEPVYPDVDVAGRDVDCTTQFCPTCLEQLARDVLECAEKFAGPPDEVLERMAKKATYPLPPVDSIDAPPSIATHATRGDVDPQRLPLPALAFGQSVLLEFEDDAGGDVVTVETTELS